MRLACICGTSSLQRKIVAYPDPTGSARKTSAQARRIMASCMGSRALSVKDRLNATYGYQKRQGDIRLWVHPRCKSTIIGMSVQRRSQDYVVDKTAGIEHWCDGLGYLILSAMNQVKPVTGSSRSRLVRSNAVQLAQTLRTLPRTSSERATPTKNEDYVIDREHWRVRCSRSPQIEAFPAE